MYLGWCMVYLGFFVEVIYSGCMLTGMTNAAKVLPRTTLRSYIMFWGAILLDTERVREKCGSTYMYSR